MAGKGHGGRSAQGAAEGARATALGLISARLQKLGRLARRHDLAVLAYLLDMALLEARQQAGGMAATGSSRERDEAAMVLESAGDLELEEHHAHGRRRTAGDAD